MDGCTGICQFVLVDGEEVPSQFSGASNPDCLAAFYALRWPVLYPNCGGNRLVLIGRIADKELTDDRYGMDEKYREFELQDWYLIAPFAQLETDEADHVIGSRWRQELKVSDFTKSFPEKWRGNFSRFVKERDLGDWLPKRTEEVIPGESPDENGDTQIRRRISIHIWPARSEEAYRQAEDDFSSALFRCLVPEPGTAIDLVDRVYGTQGKTSRNSDIPSSKQKAYPLFVWPNGLRAILLVSSEGGIVKTSELLFRDPKNKKYRVRSPVYLLYQNIYDKYASRLALISSK